MQVDLGLYGNQLTYMQSIWTAGYVIGQIPSNLILTRVRPSIWIPTMEIVWGLLTFCLSQCNTVSFSAKIAVRRTLIISRPGNYTQSGS